MKSILYILILFISVIGFSQNMQEGFSYLETGKYAEAEIYFKKALNSYPKNKTAKLCYGRAVGLHGDAPKAVAIFTELSTEYPNNFEVKLNYAEALLWNKNYTDAKNYYQKLLVEDDQSFPALLGYANTLSNLKEYPPALVYVNKALVVMPNNPNALVSKKYIQLGYADQLTKQQKYPKAIDFLKNNLSLFKGDKETLLNLANTYIIAKNYEQAKNTYQNLATNAKDSISALSGLSLVAHLEDKNKTALNISKSALDKVKNIKDENLTNKTNERYIQALIWNKKFNQAEGLINTLMDEKPNQNWLLAARATLNIYKSNFKKTLTDYNKILETEPTSFDGNLGKANALKASGKYLQAYAAAEKTFTYYKNQKDAVKFIKELDKQFTPYAESKTAYSFDNGKNNTVFTKLNINVPLSTKFKVLANYSYRTTDNSITKNQADANSLQLGLSHQWHPKVIFNALAGATTVNNNTKDYNQFLSHLYFNLKPFKLQTLDIGYQREMESFNADLLERMIVKDNLYANYNISTHFNLGWFTQYYYTNQNDGNTRNLLFTSLYYNILEKPLLKTGFNFQAIGFKNQVPTVYFSPKKFRAYEVFVNLLKSEYSTKNKAIFYDLNAATGFQFINNDDKQSTYRIQFKLGYKFSDYVSANLYGTRSNIASATAAGFTYNEIGVRVKWYFTKKPVFKRL